MKRLNLWVAAVAGASLAAAVPAGAKVAAGAPAAPAGYTLFERMPIPVLGAGGAMTPKPLAAGTAYLLRITGTFYEGVGFYGRGYGDAEYGFYMSGQVIDKCRNGVDLGVGINDTNVAPGHVKRPHWGTYRANHVYSGSFTGTGAAIRVGYHDCAYPDNRPALQWPGTGPLTLWIYAPHS
jgi:hypothetical protein